MARKHDELFKHTFGNPRHAANALQSILPASIAAVLEWSTLAVKPGTYVNEELRSRHSDQLYIVDIKGKDGLVYVLFEHQSRPDRLMPLRVLEYVVRIWRRLLKADPKLKTLPPILPVVVYHGRRGWSAPTRLSEMYALDGETLEALRPWLPEATFVLQDLTQTDDAWFENTLSAAVAVVLGSLKHSRTPVALESWLVRSLELLRKVEQAKTELEVLEAVFRYAMAADVEPERLRMLVVERLGHEAQEVLMTAADRLREEGREEGLERGLEQGREEKREKVRAIFVKLLGLRFGKLDEATLEYVETLDFERVEELSDRLLDPGFKVKLVQEFLAVDAAE